MQNINLNLSPDCGGETGWIFSTYTVLMPSFFSRRVDRQATGRKLSLPLPWEKQG
jgi:hypothetical protein